MGGPAVDQTLRILNLEDSEIDSELIQATLEAEGIFCGITRVETEREFVAAISQGGFDLLLVDYKLPSFDGMSALAIAREKCADIPFIFVSGSIGEDTAIESMKNGATDYVLKDKLSRLASSVRRALKEAGERIERKRAEEELRASEALIKTIMDNLPIGIAVNSVDPAVIFHYMNDNFVKYYRTTRDELTTPDAFWDAVYENPEFRDEMKKRVLNDCASGDPDRMHWVDVPITRRGEETTYIEARNSAASDMKLMISTVWDVTKRKRAEEALSESEARYRSIVENIALGISIISRDMKILALNGQMKRWFPNIDVYMQPLCYRAFNTPPRETVCTYCPTCRTFDDGQVHEAVTETPSGREIRRYRVVSSPVKDVDGKVTAVIEMVEDITERERMEKAIRESDRKYKSLVETIVDGVYQSDADGVFSFINQAGAEIFGCGSPDEMIGKAVIDYWADPEERERFLAEIKNRNTLKFYPIRAKKKDGVEIYLEMSSRIMEDEQGRFIGIEGILRDVTEKKRLEEQLRQAQKMEAVGQLAGGIAHDFNNILSAIIGYGDMTKRKMAPADPLRLNIEQILEAADRAAQLTKSLLAFSRKQVMDPKPADLNEIIRKTEKFLIRVIGEDIELKTQLAGPKLAVFADSGQIEQALMNLATNARDAMPEGGLLTIETYIKTLDNDFITAHGYGKPGEYAVISVTDTGIGMSEQTRLRIFEPFFTTKEMGKGTGLGMSIAYGIIKQHNGFINVYSEPGQGTMFRIYLPLIMSATAEEKKQEVGEYPVGGPETILVAEDDATLRKLSDSVLKEFGYTVILAVDGEDAIEKFRQNSDSIKLLILDMIMPKKNGKEAYDEIKKIKTDIKVLFASGYTADIMHKKGILEEGLEFIMKPLSPLDLLKKVREILDRGKNSGSG